MKQIKLKAQSFNSMCGLCKKYIAPQSYWLHSKVGGRGWNISRNLDGSVTLTVDDEKRLTLILLASNGEI